MLQDNVPEIEGIERSQDILLTIVIKEFKGKLL